MAKRSLKTSLTGQAKARQAFERTQWTQEQLALEVGLNTRQSVWKFLSGRPIDRHIFIELCFQLNLEWQNVADLSSLPEEDCTEPLPAAQPLSSAQAEISAIDQLRAYVQPTLHQQCGILQSSLELGRPLSLEQLYTPIRIVPHLRRQQWLDVADLQLSSAQQWQLRLAHAHPESVDALDILRQSSNVLLLGKPGAGKTTFLKYVALQCLAQQYRSHCVPVFLTLRYGLSSRTSSPGTESFRLLAHLTELGKNAGLSDLQCQTLLQEGGFLLLLDGLDEVSSDHLNEILQDIQSFSQTYPKNPCILTTRLSSNPPYLPGFLDVEVDDFGRDQIQTFAQQWFRANLSKPETSDLKTQQFLEALDKLDNQPLKELVTTPILLSLLCSVFLARCDFPKQRSKLYQAGLDILLQRWDQSRGIQRDQTYQHWSVAEKLRLLGKIAATTFEKGHYYFEKSELLEIIIDYGQELESTKTHLDREALYLESETILQAIQLQHGLIVERARDVYSFSHLTFQEYLTARKILYQSKPETFAQTLQQVATQVLNPNWHEVLRLTANMMTLADPLLKEMHACIQTVLDGDPACEAFLHAIQDKVNHVQTPYQPAAVRAFYFTLFSDRNLQLAQSVDKTIAQTLSPDLALDLALVRALEMGFSFLQDPSVKTLLNLIFALQLDQKFQLEPDFHTAFHDLKEELPDPGESIVEWCHASGLAWNDRFQHLLIAHRHMGHIRQLTSAQQGRLHQYYELHVFLVDCWQESQTSPEFSQILQDSLLRSS